MNDAKPQVILASNDIGAIRAAALTTGRGVAQLIDVDADGPDVVHLFPLASSSVHPGAHSIVLDWHLDVDRPPRAASDSSAARATAWVDTRGPTTVATCDLVFGAVCLESHPIEIVETGAGSFTRNLPVLETTALESASVLCVGLGSGGSIVVDQLARAGVGQFVLWDMDRLESHNIGRHVCTLRDIGRRKVLAMRDHVLAVNPNAKVRCVDKSVLGAASASQLEAAVAAADCVVVGTDNNPSRFAVNDAAWRHGKPALFGRAFQRASGGDVIQVLPPAPPCYACQLRGRVVDEEISSKKDAARIPYSDVVVPVEPGLVIDIHPIANMLARLALLRLCEKRDGKLSAVAAEARDPLYLWANRREGQFARWRPMDRSYDRLATYRWYGINVRRDEECTTCGDGADAS